MSFARHGPGPHVDPIYEYIFRRLEFTNDESHQVGGHLHRFFEFENLFVAMRHLTFAQYPTVRDSRHFFWYCKRYFVSCFEVWLVETWKGTPGIGRFKLRAYKSVLLAGFI